MKKCPTCDKTFDDSMRFCQTDGTPLVEIFDVPAADNDPYRTVVGRQDGSAPAEPIDPFKTMVAGSRKNDESGDLLQLPQEQDPLKTMYVSDEELKREMHAIKPKQEGFIDVAPLNDATSIDERNVPPSSNSPFSTPNFSENKTEVKSGFESGSSDYLTDDSSVNNNNANPFSNPPQSPSSPFGNQTNLNESKNPFDSSPYETPGTPIPSPFGESKPSSYQMPSAPLPPKFKEEEIRAEAFNTPFAEEVAAHQSQPLQAAEWTPPPAPESSWQNQEIGANTPFQPPISGNGGDKTLAIVSLVCGILSVTCCGAITGIIALVTGYMAKNNADNNPQQYGGRGMALAGIILGAISLVLTVLLIILQITLGVLGNL